MKKSPAFLVSTGFTLLEVLLVVTIIGIFIIPLYLSYTRTQANQGLRSTTEQLSDMLTQAHIFSREARDTKAWGVIRSSETTFSLASGNPSTYTISINKTAESGVSFPEDFSIWFNIGTGEMESSKTVTVQNKYGNTRTIDISKTGIIQVNNEE